MIPGGDNTNDTEGPFVIRFLSHKRISEFVSIGKGRKYVGTPFQLATNNIQSYNIQAASSLDYLTFIPQQSGQ